VILVTGSRSFHDDDHARLLVEQRLRLFLPGTTLMQGGAPGVDSWAADIGRALGFLVLTVHADWLDHTGCNCRNKGTNGRCLYAGFRRNRQMLDEKPQLVLGFWNGWSPGTRDCLDEARRRALEVELHTITADRTETTCPRCGHMPMRWTQSSWQCPACRFKVGCCEGAA
jgi:hypothetical protein